MNVGFKPTTSGKTSWSRLLVTSNADNGTETIYLSGASQSTGLSSNSLGTISGNVGTVLSLTLGSSASFGSFTPAFGRNYDAATSANVVSTAANAALRGDPDTAQPGQAGQRRVRAVPAAAGPCEQRRDTSSALRRSAAAGARRLMSYTSPTAGADGVTVGFRQAILSNEVLRAGTYGKTLTFTVSTTEP